MAAFVAASRSGIRAKEHEPSQLHKDNYHGRVEQDRTYKGMIATAICMSDASVFAESRPTNYGVEVLEAIDYSSRIDEL